ncbi:UBX domain-containing protein 8 [Holothuria leucospilota]|uniref:UBX domain-containing protein 8 n=1 Tax=Holothuria leucospilota TaxID=206669 RepID=A0A9Q0YHD2_HOLLE|nr:UBX domain-containing protein 8 [Holothuria leucospilota]
MNGQSRMENSVDAASLIHSSLVGLFYLTVVVLLWTVFGNKVKKLWKQLHKEPTPTQTRIPNDVQRELKEASRKRIDEEHQSKAADYEERVLRPREEAKKAHLEKEFRRFTGPAWKGKSYPLGTDEENINEPENLRRRRGGNSRDAAQFRKLPESERKLDEQEEVPKPKKIITLPEEPPDGTPESITVAMRGLTDVKKRRFLKSEKVQVLIDWMTKQGYHPKLYTLYTIRPRHDLSLVQEESLEKAGLIRDVVVFIEERDDSESS